MRYAILRVDYAFTAHRNERSANGFAHSDDKIICIDLYIVDEVIIKYNLNLTWWYNNYWKP